MASKNYLNQLKNLGSSRAVLIKYSTSKLSDSQKVLLHYKLNGRASKKGILSKTGSLLIAKSVILAPEDTSQEILSFLRKSNCRFKIRHLIINPSKLVELSKLALQFKKKHSSILDIRLIESGSKKQVCIIAHAENLPSISKELASRIKLPVIHIQASQLLAPDSKLLETIRAGTSLLKEVPALPTKKLFRYSTKHLKGSEKVKFHYELSGRDKEGIIAQTQSEFFAKSIIIAPNSKAEAIRRFLQKYSCEFVELEVAEISHGY